MLPPSNLNLHRVRVSLTELDELDLHSCFVHVRAMEVTSGEHLCLDGQHLVQGTPGASCGRAHVSLRIRASSPFRSVCYAAVRHNELRTERLGCGISSVLASTAPQSHTTFLQVFLVCMCFSSKH